jgi:hypothetical protein
VDDSVFVGVMKRFGRFFAQAGDGAKEVVVLDRFARRQRARGANVERCGRTVGSAAAFC